jgi:hypothetical protein
MILQMKYNGIFLTAERIFDATAASFFFSSKEISEEDSYKLPVADFTSKL